MTGFDLNQGALAPLLNEVDIVSLDVTGNIPSELNVVPLRNGLNPLSDQFESHDLLSWWPEVAMFHGLYFEDGKVVQYRNRWARTRQRGAHQSSDDVGSKLDSNPNVNFVNHAGELLALGEGAIPLLVNTDWESLGQSRQNGIKNGVTAHPKKRCCHGRVNHIPYRLE